MKDDVVEVHSQVIFCSHIHMSQFETYRVKTRYRVGVGIFLPPGLPCHIHVSPPSDYSEEAGQHGCLLASGSEPT